MTYIVARVHWRLGIRYYGLTDYYAERQAGYGLATSTAFNIRTANESV